MLCLDRTCSENLTHTMLHVYSMGEICLLALAATRSLMSIPKDIYDCH